MQSLLRQGAFSRSTSCCGMNSSISLVELRLPEHELCQIGLLLQDKPCICTQGYFGGINNGRYGVGPSARRIADANCVREACPYVATRRAPMPQLKREHYHHSAWMLPWALFFPASVVDHILRPSFSSQEQDSSQ